MKPLIPLLMAASVGFSAAATSGTLSDKYGVSVPLGKDSQKRVFSTLFNIELWSKTIPLKYDQDLTIRIEFLSRFDRSDVVEFLSEEAQEIHEFPRPVLASLQEQLSASITCTPKANTILDFNFIPGKGIEVTCDGEVSSKIIQEGPNSYYLLDVFLHSESEYEKLINN